MTLARQENRKRCDELRKTGVTRLWLVRDHTGTEIILDRPVAVNYHIVAVLDNNYDAGGPYVHPIDYNNRHTSESETGEEGQGTKPRESTSVDVEGVLSRCDDVDSAGRSQGHHDEQTSALENGNEGEGSANDEAAVDGDGQSSYGGSDEECFSFTYTEEGNREPTQQLTTHDHSQLAVAALAQVGNTVAVHANSCSNCYRRRKGCNRARPCERCRRQGLTAVECIDHTLDPNHIRRERPTRKGKGKGKADRK